MGENLPRESIQCALLVLGAGPAGIAAALHAATRSCDVLLIDKQRDPGGQIWRGQWQSLLHAPRSVSALARAPLLELQNAMRDKRLRFIGSCRVVLAAAANRVRCDGENPLEIEFARIIVACGARELFLPFPGWELPGVTGAGGLQLMAKEGAKLSGQRIVVAGSGVLLLAVAATLMHKGAEVVAIVEQQSRAELIRFVAGFWRWPELLLQAASLRWQTRHIPYLRGSWITRAQGDNTVELVHWQNERGDSAVIACDWLACAFGLVPNQEILALLGAAAQGPDSVHTSRPDVFIAGEMIAVGGARRALVSGALAAASALADQSKIKTLQARLRRWQRYVLALQTHFRLRTELRSLATEQTIFCRCENVAMAAVRTCSSFREAKLCSRLGMGACQGRICGAAAQALYGWPISHTRSPLTPTAIAAFVQSNPQSNSSPTREPK